MFRVCSPTLEVRIGEMSGVQFALALVLLLHLSVAGTNGLSPYGKNVCSERHTYSTYYTTRRSYTSYTSYRTCCKKIWFVCTSRCTRYRARTAYHYVSRLGYNTRTTYRCCSGWIQSGSECPTPICNPACQNGDCVRPSTCSCYSGFQGSYCQSDIDECQSRPCDQACRNLPGSYACSCKRGYRKTYPHQQQNGNCQNVNECASNRRLCTCAVEAASCKASCIDTIGSYKCRCSPGYQLVRGTICKDLNECKVAKGNCEHDCINSLGSYRCGCWTGYRLANDGKKCKDVNECLKANGGCEQICSNTKGSYICSCKSGYNLAYDKATCTDINECTKIKPCDQENGICQNTQGSYTCSCKPGYKLTDNHRCIDIDECQGSNKCGHVCHNNIGSYHCSCRNGYQLASDNRTCIDVDECKARTHDCDQNCINNIGSYSCRCDPGYRLQDDKRTCRALPCRRLYNPKNGAINCTGLNYGQRCEYTCNLGFRMIGNKTRICQLFSKWSGTTPRCVPKVCPMMHPPLNGILELPCINQYNQSCKFRCNQGFFLTGNKTTKCDIDGDGVIWKSQNAACREIKLCKPNPCKHGGRCQLKSVKEFECDCSGTGYIGEHCQLGTMQITSYPPLINGKASDWLEITAKPSKELIIIPQALDGNAIFEPKKVVIRYPLTSGKLRIIPKTSGVLHIRYTLSGRNWKKFSPLPDSTVYVQAVDASKELIRIPNKDFVQSQCYKTKLDICKNGQEIKLLSSCPWSRKGSKGYQSIAAGDIKIPLSLAGIKLPAKSMSSWMYRAKGILTVSKELNDALITGHTFCKLKEACKESLYTKAENQFIVQQNLFLRSHIASLSNLLPQWLRVRMKHGYSGFSVNNFQSMILKSTRISDLKICLNFPVKMNPSSIHAAQIVFAPLTLQALGMQVDTDSTYPTCIATDLCKKITYISLPKDKTINFTPHLQSLGVKNLSVRLHGVAFAANSTIEQKCSKRYEAEDSFCVAAQVWMKISSNFENEIANISLEGEAFIETEELSKVAFSRFTAAIKYSYEGFLLADIQLRAAGEQIVFKIREANATVFGSFGHPIAKINANNLRGFIFNINSQIDIVHGTSLVSFHPVNNGEKFRSSGRVIYGLLGGKVVDVANRNRLRFKVRFFHKSLTRSADVLLRLLNQHRYIYSVQIAALGNLKNNVKELHNEMMKVLKDISGGYENIYSLITRVKNIADFGYDIASAVSQVSNAEKHLIRKMSILRTLKLFKLALKKCSEMNAMPESTKVSENFSGLDINYFGKLCFHAICFENLKVTIQDHACLKDGRNCDSNFLVVSAIFSRRQTIANQFNVTKGSMLYAMISKNEYQFNVTIPIKVRLFATEVSTVLEINAEEIHFLLPKFRIAEGLNFDLKVTASNSKNTVWQNVLFSMSGTASKASNLTNELESMIKTYISDTAELIKARHANASGRVSQLNCVLMNWKSNLTTTRKIFNELKLELAKSKASYETSLTNLNMTKITFNSYSVKSRFFIDIQTDLETLFPLASCKKSCISIPVCQICQEPVKVDANTLECNLIEKRTITTVAKTIQSKCQVTNYRYKTIYTGTCKKRFPIEASIISIGTGVGSIIGSILGPPGTAVGALVGGIVGGIVGGFVSLFSSCDTTYKAVKEEINSQVDCTKIIYESHQVTWKEASCDNKNVEVISGFSTPKECNCFDNKCITLQDHNCAYKNEVARSNRSQYVRTKMKEAGEYNDGYDNLQNAEKYVESNYTRFVEDESRYLVAKGNHEKAASKVKLLELEIKLVTRSMDNFNENFALERCIANIAKKTMEKPLVVKKIQFHSSASTSEELLLKVTVVRSDLGFVAENNFLLNHRNAALSMKQGARTIAKETFCLHRLRKRRSAEGSLILRQNLGNNFVQQSTKIDQNATMAERACLVSSTIFSFLKRSFDDLSHNIAAIEIRKLRIMQSWEMTQNRQTEESGKGQNKLVQSLKSQLESDNRTLTVENILKDWIDNMEISTAAYNFTKCIGFEDCVRESLRQISLSQLPSLILTNQDRFQQNINYADTKFSTLLAANSISSLKLAAAELKQYLMVIEDLSAFCAKPPTINLDSPEVIERSTGSELKLRCISPSSLSNMTYSWTRDNIPLLSEGGNVLRMLIDKDKNGAYKCIASNNAGTGTSQETLVITRDKPTLVSQPIDFQYYSTMPDEITPLFACNVTAHPPANVSWFFQPFSSNVTSKLGFTELVLDISRPIASDAGFYYCKAENKAGLTESRKARLDVLKGRISNQGFTMTYDLPELVADIQGKEAYKARLTTYARLSTNQYINVSLNEQPEGSVKVVVSVTEKLDMERKPGENSEIDFLRRVSMSRKILATSLQNIVLGLKSNNTREENAAIAESIRINVNTKLCPPGYVMHENGFSCVQCPAGTSQQEGSCVNCSIGMFQWKAGQTSCVPCNDSFVTDEVGSVNEFQCIPHVLKSADVIFVVDKSWNIRMYDWRKVLRFLEKSIKELNIEKNDVRVGIVSFDSYTMIWFPLHKYSTENLIRRLHDIPYHAGITLTYTALNLVEQDLHVKYRADRKQIAIVILGGPSSYFGGRTGFFLTRRAAMRLHHAGVHVLAVGVSNRVDSAELKAIASYPKLSNVIQLGNFNLLTEASKKILGMAPKDNCSPDAKDIAILIEASVDVSKESWNLTQIFTERLLGELQSPQHKISVTTFHSELQLQRAYKEISSVTEINTIVRNLSRNEKERSSGYRGFIADVYNNLMTEKWNSVSPTKIAIFLSKDVIDRRILTDIRRDYPKEKIHFLGVVMSADPQKIKENVSLKLEEDAKFNMAQVSDIVEIIQEIDSGTKLCSSG